MPVEIKVNEWLARFGYLAEYCSSPGLPPEGHEHDGLELGVLHQGTARFRAAHWEHTLAPSIGILFNGRSTHFTSAVQGRYVRTCVAFLPDLIRDVQLRDYCTEIVEGNGPHLFAIAPDSIRRFTWAVNELNAMSHRGSSEKLRIHILEMILLDLYEERTHGTPLPTALEEAIAYMRHHIDSRNYIADLARRLYYSESQLRHIFKRHTGYSPQEYWNRLKIERACELLRNTGLSVQDVSAAVGFASLSGFQRAFKRETGLSPTLYREARPLRQSTPAGPGAASGAF